MPLLGMNIGILTIKIYVSRILLIAEKYLLQISIKNKTQVESLLSVYLLGLFHSHDTHSFDWKGTSLILIAH